MAKKLSPIMIENILMKEIITLNQAVGKRNYPLVKITSDKISALCKGLIKK